MNFGGLDHDLHHYDDDTVALPDAHGIPAKSAPKVRKWATVRKEMGHASKVKQVLRAWNDAVESGNRKRLTLQILAVLACGCASVIPAELILKKDPAGMKMIAVSNYLFSIISTLLAAGPSLLIVRKIPLRFHMGNVAAGYGYNVLQNAAFGFGLAMPLALVVKNGGMLCQMVVGAAVISEAYSTKQILAAITVTVGITITVFAIMKPAPNKDDAKPEDVSDSSMLTIAVILMLAAMMSRSLGSVVSQKAFVNYGKQYHEALFYQSAFGLPLLLLEWQTLMGQASRWTTGVTEELFGVDLPILWIYLVASMVLNSIVTKATAVVNSLSNSVTLNLVLVMQRFISIVVSATIFNAPPYPPPLMWCGAVLVLCGCIAYVMAPKAEKSNS